MNLYSTIAVAAIAILSIAEILIAYQKYQMKKQFLDDLDHGEARG